MKPIRSAFILFLAGMIALGASNAIAAPVAQSLSTPTPGADGRIVWIVQEGQNCNLISSISGVPVTQLRTLNRLDENCTLRIGQEVLIGIIDPNAQMTAEAPQIQVTSTPVPTPTKEVGQAVICVLLYDDVNGDALRQEEEGTIADGAISVSGNSGQFSQTATTTNSIEPVCFEGVLSGPYTISIGLPEGYNPTTQQNYSLEIVFGEQVYVDFGAQTSGVMDIVAANEPTPTSSTGNLAVIGVILILSAVGLGVYAFFSSRNKTTL